MKTSLISTLARTFNLNRLCLALSLTAACLTPASGQTVSYQWDAFTTEPVVYGGKLAQVIFKQAKYGLISTVMVGNIQDANLVSHPVFRTVTKVLGYVVPNENDPDAPGAYGVTVQLGLPYSNIPLTPTQPGPMRAPTSPAPGQQFAGAWVCDRNAIQCNISQSGMSLGFSHANGSSGGRVLDGSHIEGWGDRATLSADGRTLTWGRGDVWRRK